MTKAFVLLLAPLLLPLAGCGSGGTGVSPTPSAKDVASPSEALSPSEGRALVVLARQTLEAELAGRTPPRYRVHAERLRREGGGAFVTLETAEGRLRGCIGRFESPYPLYGTVQAMAIAAARHDRRFPEVTATELPALRIRVSVLSPLRRLPAPPLGIERGRHGIMVRRGDRRGCYLPEVALQTRWSVEDFLERCTVEKAGLEPGAWRRADTEVLVFTSQVFEEEAKG